MRTALIDSGRGRSPAAVALAERAARLDPDNIVIRDAAATVAGSGPTLASVDAGLTQVDSGLWVSPADPVLGDEQAALLVKRAQITGADVDWRAAQAALARLQASDPLNPAVLLQAGVAADVLGQPAAAQADLTAAAELDPASPVPDEDLALLYQQEGRPDAARQASDAARSVGAGDVDGTR